MSEQEQPTVKHALRTVSGLGRPWADRRRPRLRKRNVPIAAGAVILLVAIAVLLTGGLAALQGRAVPCSHCNPAARGCTVFTIAQGDRVFFGGNGDWINMEGNYYWVDPGDERRHGAIYFGKPDNVQQGFNEKGLAYDSNGLPPAPVSTHPGREPVYGGYTRYPIRILQACATVEEVIAWVQAHRWHEAMHDQMHFADAGGGAVVISAGPDGRVAFTRKPAGDGCLVSTNFNLANRGNGSWPCWRYDRARGLLAEIDGPGELTAARAASVLDAVHVESATAWTVLSVLGDLPRGLVYVYLFHQFDAPIVLDVAEEIAQAPAPGPLRDRFPPQTVCQVDRAYRRLAARGARCDAAGLAWLGLVVASLVAFFFLARRDRRGRAFWGLVVLALGPLGLLAWRFAARGRRRPVLVETVGALVPCIPGTVAALLVAVAASETSQSALLQLLAQYGLPLAVGLFAYQGPFLALAGRRSYLRTLLERLPAAIVATNLALAGLLAVALPAVKGHVEGCGFGALTALSWWAIAALGALAGGLVLSTYHAWAVRRGFGAWSPLLWAPGDKGPAVSSPSWRRLWVWIPASSIVLVAGIVLGALGSSLLAAA